MSIPKFEDVAQTQWFHDDQSFVHELTVRFNASFKHVFPSRLTGEMCERAQHECVEQLRRYVHESVAGTCKPTTYDNGYSIDRVEIGECQEFYEPACACSECGELIPMRKFCPNCGRRIVREVDA